MGIGAFIFWALAGWCGTPYPRRWPFPPPGPDPEPWWYKVIGLVSGIAGGYIFYTTLISGIIITDGMQGINIAASGFGAYVGSTVITDIVRIAIPRAK